LSTALIRLAVPAYGKILERSIVLGYIRRSYDRRLSDRVGRPELKIKAKAATHGGEHCAKWVERRPAGL
jgi:hypothetical protein